MNKIIGKKEKEQMPEEVMDKALNLYNEGKSVSRILILFPDYEKELIRMFKAIDVLKKQKSLVSAPEKLLKKIISAVSFDNLKDEKEKADGANVTNSEDNRYLYENNQNKGRFFTVNFFNLFRLHTMKKMYIGFAVFLLLAVAVTGISHRRSLKKQNAAVTNLPTEETNKLAQDQEALSKDIVALEEIGANDASLDNINQDLADISGEQISAEEISKSNNANNTNKAVSVASIETLEKDFASEIANLSTDIQGLEGINNDASLDSLDSELGGI